MLHVKAKLPSGIEPDKQIVKKKVFYQATNPKICWFLLRLIFGFWTVGQTKIIFFWKRECSLNQKCSLQIVCSLIFCFWLHSEVSVTQRLCAVSTNTTVKNVEASRRHTRGQNGGSFSIRELYLSFIHIVLYFLEHLNLGSDIVIFVI